MHAFFYDTWAFIALANRGDAHHDLCSEGDRSLEAMGYAAVTSDYVLDETLTGLHVGAGAAVARAFLDLVEARIDAEDLLLLEVTSTRRAEAIRIFRRLSQRSRAGPHGAERRTELERASRSVGSGSARRQPPMWRQTSAGRALALELDPVRALDPAAGQRIRTEAGEAGACARGCSWSTTSCSAYAGRTKK